MNRELFEQKFNEESSELSTQFKDFIKESNEQLGEAMRLVICMEEASELSQAISKIYRNKGDRLNLIEEIGDMMICIESLKQLYNITEGEVNKAINVKIHRGVS